ncbi:MAG: hypothetical protein Q7L07_08765 [Pseudohongiella sp.]|nr:hypothetical protein [Pseudohongiella sp.]
MFRKVVLALILVMHYSLAFGAIEAAAMPDELHPFGKAIPHDHLHQHVHDHHDDLEHAHDHHSPAQPDGGIEFHEHQHNHSISIQLNMDVPVTFAFDFHNTEPHPATPYRNGHRSLSYAPAVPPPNTL